MWQAFVDYLVYQLLGLSPQSHLGSALNFFIYDSVKILMLLSVIIFAVAIIRSFFPPEKTRKILSHKREFISNIVAALMGIVTPFCSCSAVPVFIGFVEAGVPLGATFSFLISSPMVNEVALGLLWVMFGWKIALIYIGSGLVVAIVGGLVIGRLKLEHLVEDYVYEISSHAKRAAAETSCAEEDSGPSGEQIILGGGEACCSSGTTIDLPMVQEPECYSTPTVSEPAMSWRERVEYGRNYVIEIVGKVWLYARPAFIPVTNQIGVMIFVSGSTLRLCNFGQAWAEVGQMNHGQGDHLGLKLHCQVNSSAQSFLAAFRTVKPHQYLTDIHLNSSFTVSCCAFITCLHGSLDLRGILGLRHREEVFLGDHSGNNRTQDNYGYDDTVLSVGDVFIG